MRDTEVFLRTALERGQIWDDEDLVKGMLALSKKCDIHRPLKKAYDGEWKKVAVNEPVSREAWEALIELLCRHVPTASSRSMRLKLLNSAANAMDVLASITGGGPPAASRERWENLWERVST